MPWSTHHPGGTITATVGRHDISRTGRAPGGGSRMDADRARELLAAERDTVVRMLTELDSAARDDRAAETDIGDQVDAADPIVAEGVDDAVAAGLRDRLAAVERAEKRLSEGTFGLSIRSGLPIPDERLEVMPTAELTVEEATARR